MSNSLEIAEIVLTGNRTYQKILCVFLFSIDYGLHFVSSGTTMLESPFKYLSPVTFSFECIVSSTVVWISK